MSFAEHNLNDNASPSPLLESTSLPLPTLPSLTPVPLPVSKRFNLKLSYANQKKPTSPFAIVYSIDSVENLHDLSKHLKEKDDIDLFTFNQSLNNFTSYISTDNTTIYNQIKRQIAQSRTILAQISENYESLYQQPITLLEKQLALNELEKEIIQSLNGFTSEKHQNSHIGMIPMEDISRITKEITNELIKNNFYIQTGIILHN